MNKSVIYIVGATVLVGGAYLFLKNKKAKDLAKLDELGGTTTGGTTTGGTTTGGTTPSGTTSGGTTPPLSTTSDGVSPSDANLNLANVTLLATQRKTLFAVANKSCLGLSSSIGVGLFDTGTPRVTVSASSSCNLEKLGAKQRLIELDKKLANLGYKVDAVGQLVKI
jgi:hypothetical protein